MNIKVHNPANDKTRYFRNYNLFWDELTEALKLKHNVIENRNFEHAHEGYSYITLRKQTVDKFRMLECEYIIEDLDGGDFYVLTVSDMLDCAALCEKSNSHLKKVLISQYNRQQVIDHTNDNNNKYFPWIYFPSDLTDLEYYYNKRKNTQESDFIKKMYFRGTSIEDRPILKFFNESLFTGPHVIGSPDKYFNDLIKYRVGLSVAGRGEFCYRDIEYMAIGIPFIRFEYQSEMYEPLVPNYHYISVEYDNDIPIHYGYRTDRLGEYKHAKKIESRFVDIVSNKEFLDFISKNARQYYLDNLISPNRVNKTLEILGL